MGPKAQKAMETRGRLMGAARELFASQGYAATGTEAVLAAAGVTRGALYHHFADKQALFAAVCEELHAEAAKVIEAAADAEARAYSAVLAGSLAFLDFMAAPEVRRILLLDAPSVLGWEAWNEMDRRHGFGLLVRGVEAAVAEGSLDGDPQVLAVLLNGALNEGVVWAAGDPAAMNRLRNGFAALMARLHV